jgi:hypothetical protein
MKATRIVKQDYQIKPNKMKATLTFDLREDQHAFDCVVNATKMHEVIVEFRSDLRWMEDNGNYSEEELKAAAKLLKLLDDEIESSGLSHLF